MKPSVLARGVRGAWWVTMILCLILSRWAVAAQAARVVILETSPVDLPELGPNALKTGVATALQNKGADVVPSNGLRAEQLACTSPSCYVTIANAAGATHVLRIEGAYANDGYTVQVELWYSRTGKVARSERYHCDLCAPENMIAAARDQATLLWVQDGADTTTPAANPVTVGIQIPAPPTAKPPVPVWPWGLVAGGGALAIGGVVALIHGDSSSCAQYSASDCGRYRDYTTPGVILVAGGAVVAAAGAGYLLYRHFRPESAAPLVAIGPGSILLEGRF